MRGSSVRSAVAVVTVILILTAGCGSGISLVIRPQPSECFQQDVVDVGCRTRQTIVSVCEEDFFGFVDCYDDVVIDVLCEEIVVDSFLICE